MSQPKGEGFFEATTDPSIGDNTPDGLAIGKLMPVEHEPEDDTQEFVIPPKLALDRAVYSIQELGRSKQFKSLDELTHELQRMFGIPTLPKDGWKHYPIRRMPILFNNRRYYIELRFNLAGEATLPRVFFDKISERE